MSAAARRFDLDRWLNTVSTWSMTLRHSRIPTFVARLQRRLATSPHAGTVAPLAYPEHRPRLAPVRLARSSAVVYAGLVTLVAARPHAPYRPDRSTPSAAVPASTPCSVSRSCDRDARPYGGGRSRGRARRRSSRRWRRRVRSVG